MKFSKSWISCVIICTLPSILAAFIMVLPLSFVPKEIESLAMIGYLIWFGLFVFPATFVVMEFDYSFQDVAKLFSHSYLYPEIFGILVAPFFWGTVLWYLYKKYTEHIGR